jgi:hypothetical protein
MARRHAPGTRPKRHHHAIVKSLFASFSSEKEELT